MAFIVITIRQFSLQMAKNMQYWAFFNLAYTNQIQSSHYKSTIVPFLGLQNENRT